jgi:hypothetical protein
VIKHRYSLSSTNFAYEWEICGSWARELSGSEIIVMLGMLIGKLDTYFKLPPMNNIFSSRTEKIIGIFYNPLQ